MNRTLLPSGCLPSSLGGDASGDVLLGTALALSILLLGLCIVRRRCWGGSAAQTGIADHYRLIAQSSGEVFFELDVKSRFIAWTSDLGAGFLGYNPGEITLQESSLLSLVHRLDLEPMKKAWERLLLGERLDMEVRLLKKDSQWCWVHILAVPQTSPAGKIGRIVGVVRNTQELHETQDALAEARRLETVGTMAGGIAHEFNNHLTPVRGYIEMALDQVGPDHPAAESLRTALGRVEYCSDLVSQIQAYGRKSLLLPKPVEVNRVLPSLVRVAMSTSMGRERAGKVSLVEQWPPTLPTIWVDQAQLQQAIIALIRNSLQAMPKGGTLTIRAEESYLDAKDCIDRHGARPGDFVQISVVDTGAGISRDVLEHVLDPFYTTRSGEARGMGLKMVQGMVSQHGGWLEISSEVGRGTRVSLFFPVKKVKEVQAPRERPDADGTVHVLPAAPLGRMLVADDEEFIRDIIKRVFENEGWEVEQAVDNAEVWQLLKERPDAYDLIILDVTMPGPTAEETVAEIARTQPRTKILVISGFARDSRVDQLIEMGNAEFMGKPFSPKEILSRVDRMMAEPG